MRYLVRYYNGRGNREMLFSSLDEAKKFLAGCEDKQATLWKEITDE